MKLNVDDRSLEFVPALSTGWAVNLRGIQVQRDHVVEQVAAAASDPTLGDAILPGTPNRGTDRCHLQRADRR